MFVSYMDILVSKQPYTKTPITAHVPTSKSLPSVSEPTHSWDDHDHGVDADIFL